MGKKNRIGDCLWRFCQDEDGPTTVEYAVIIALILAVCMVTIGTLAASLKDNFDQSADALTKAGS